MRKSPSWATQSSRKLSAGASFLSRASMYSESTDESASVLKDRWGGWGGGIIGGGSGSGRGGSRGSSGRVGEPGE